MSRRVLISPAYVSWVAAVSGTSDALVRRRLAGGCVKYRPVERAIDDALWRIGIEPPPPRHPDLELPPPSPMSKGAPLVGDLAPHVVEVVDREEDVES